MSPIKNTCTEHVRSVFRISVRNKKNKWEKARWGHPQNPRRNFHYRATIHIKTACHGAPCHRVRLYRTAGNTFKNCLYYERGQPRRLCGTRVRRHRRCYYSMSQFPISSHAFIWRTTEIACGLLSRRWGWLDSGFFCPKVPCLVVEIVSLCLSVRAEALKWYFRDHYMNMFIFQYC